MQLKYKFAQYIRRFFFTLCALQHCLHFTGANENAPRNQVVVAGSRPNVTLQCRSDSNGISQWNHIQELRGKENTVTYNQNISLNGDRITLNTTLRGQYDLHITNVDRSDAGIYVCITEGKSADGNGSSITQRYEAQLVILASDPNCSLISNTLVEKDYFQMHCYVRLRGHLFPVMIWRREGQLVDGAESNITKALQGDQITVRSSLSLQVSLMDNGIRFSCETIFTPNVYNESSDGLLTRAKNAPDYNFTWTSPLLSVSSGPNNVTIRNEFGENTARLARNSTETGHMCDTNTSEIHCIVASSNLIHSNTSIVFVVLVLVVILSALILIVIGRRNNIICRYNKGNGENRSEIENDCSLYSDVRDERNAWSFRIASNDYYQNGKREGQVETGNNNVSHDNLVAIYDEVKTYECDLTATGDSMHYASVELSTPQCDIRCTKGLNSNSIKQETLKPNQNVGADGTIYTEVKGTENLYSTVQKEPKSTSFKKSDYAAIDHTVKSLPPPPRLPQ